MMMVTQDSGVATKEGPNYDVVVHIGIHKTGSSALQYFLLQNREILEKHGFFYPFHPVNQNKISGGHTDLGLLLQKKDVDGAALLLDQYAQEARSKGCTLLLSSEMIFPCFAELKLATEKSKLSARILAFFRDPLERISSIHGQVIKQDYETRTTNDYCRFLIEKGDLRYFSGEMILNWIAEFGEGNVDILPYDPVLLASQKIEHVFLNEIGVRDNFWPEFSYIDKLINKSYTETAKEFKRLLNIVLDRSDTHRQLNSVIDMRLQKFSDEHTEPEIELSSLLQKEVFDKLSSLFGKSGRQVREHIHASMRNEWLSYGSESETGGKRNGISRHQYSLAYIVESVFSDRPDVLSYIQDCTHECIQRDGFTPDMIRLADAVGIEVPSTGKLM